MTYILLPSRQSYRLVASSLPSISSSKHLLQPTRQFTTSNPISAKSPPGRGKDALRKARRQKLLDERKLVRMAKKGVSSGGVTAEPVLGMTKEQREQKREQEKKDEELSLIDAGNVLKAHGISRPLQAYELHIVTTVSSHQSNALRGRLSLPKDPRTKGEHIIIFCEEGSELYNSILQISKELGIKTNTNFNSEQPQQDSTETNPSSISSSQTQITIGGESLISSISNNRFSTNFTKVLSTQTILSSVSKSLARSLGPKGLMPSLKRGTVATNSKEFEISIRDAKGSMDWRGDRNGVVRGKCGRLDFEIVDLKKNVRAILEAVVERVSTGMVQGGGNSTNNQTNAVQSVKVFNEASLLAKKSPSQLKKARSIIKQVHLSSTQGPGIRLNLDEVLG